MISKLISSSKKVRWEMEKLKDWNEKKNKSIDMKPKNIFITINDVIIHISLMILTHNFPKPIFISFFLQDFSSSPSFISINSLSFANDTVHLEQYNLLVPFVKSLYNHYNISLHVFYVIDDISDITTFI